MCDHFMSFAVAVCIPISPNLAASAEQMQYVRKLLTYFVVEGHNIVGAEFLVYNAIELIHLAEFSAEFLVYNAIELIHLADDAQRHGSTKSVVLFP